MFLLSCPSLSQKAADHTTKVSFSQSHRLAEWQTVRARWNLCVFVNRKLYNQINLTIHHIPSPCWWFLPNPIGDHRNFIPLKRYTPHATCHARNCLHPLIILQRIFSLETWQENNPIKILYHQGKQCISIFGLYFGDSETCHVGGLPHILDAETIWKNHSLASSNQYKTHFQILNSPHAFSIDIKLSGTFGLSRKLYHAPPRCEYVVEVFPFPKIKCCT